MIVAGYDVLVDPSYHQFALHDPTREESPNFEVAIPAASRDVVGWAPNTVAVQVVTHLVQVRVRIEVLGGPPVPDVPAHTDEVDLNRDGMLELPGGQLSVPKSLDEQWILGLTLPTGPGTYRVRVTGYNRARVGRLWLDRG
ncbi:hypothetical protein HC028_13650 [Planosporangium flavigriseum]|uniref:Uncharacterized protein n=1 Tax=Planosporangium flavigriseum TaxID=373681 RepID=A0A8J3LKT2_9ACTN|nr:hypothetical protein [Planosporangium flavigriseum]NJC65540.1 hypothetical protein [Planosporangium flavigriseum]GIG75023.1 hypothetical protein Pfl04_34270 [Planosporangium flavigriseum]